MMMSSNSQIQDIMLRHLNGEATAVEAEALLQWIRESSANKAEFDLVKRLWSDTVDAAMHNMDVEKAWQHVYAQTVEKQTKIITLFPWKKMMAIAASVLLIVSAYYFFNRPVETVWHETLASNANKQIRLSDGTVITLRKGGKLLLPENFGKSSRQAKLEGEAYFEIIHDSQRPFLITTPRCVIQDIGTAFLVQNSGSTEQVTVLEGEVSFISKDKKGQELRLHAGESAVLEKEKLQRRVVETANLLSWKTDTLVFSNTPLSQVAKDLERYYSILVQLPDDLRSVHITAQFKNEPLEQVLRELHLFTGLEFQIKGRSLVISKN
ncbi:FecR family protein [Flavisolibacter nicotianae]|uniref:FecR family protein n=1 Tax=Flavisolibacter nicotianae TaxID=2364882 RepID=UPI0013C4549E|nr:FecR domain-containing protein [Flavisolibacter nicotianae]